MHQVPILLHCRAKHLITTGYGIAIVAGNQVLVPSSDGAGVNSPQQRCGVELNRVSQSISIDIREPVAVTVIVSAGPAPSRATAWYCRPPAVTVPSRDSSAARARGWSSRAASEPGEARAPFGQVLLERHLPSRQYVFTK
jgi:hypothetical protein